MSNPPLDRAPSLLARSRLVILLLGVSSLLALPLEGRAEATSEASPARTPSQRARQLADGVEAADHPSVAVAHLRAMQRIEAHLPRSAYRETLDELAAAVDDPLVAFRLERAYARLQLETGRHDAVGYDGMQGTLGEQGCLTDWRVVGPFDNDSMQGFRNPLPPEKGEAGPYEGKMTSVRWRDLPEVDRLCAHRLQRTVQPATAAVAYLAAEIEVDRARDAHLLVGADSAYTIWVDGERVGRQSTNVGFAPDNHAWPVELERGTHRVLVKFGTKQQGRLGFSARLVDSELEPLADVEVRPNWSGDPVESASTDSDASSSEGSNDPKTDDGPSASGKGLFARTRSCARDSGSTAAWCVWLWSQLESRSAATPWLDEVERLVGPLTKADEPTSVETELEGRDVARLSELFETHWRRLDGLEVARAMAPNDAWLAMEQAGAYGRSIERTTALEARSALERIVDEHPSFWPATLRLADWYGNHGFERRALEMVRGMELARARDRPAYLRRLASLERQAGTTDRARRARKEIAAIDVFSSGYAWQRVSELAAEGNPERALEIVRERRRLQPASTRWAFKEVEFLRATDRTDDALAALEEMIETKPGDASVRRRKAELLVALDRSKEAVDTLEVATTLAPQNKSLGDFLSHLQPDTRKFHEPWMVENARKMAEKHPAGSYAHDRVVDQTIFHVEPNGLYQKVIQRVERVNTKQGVGAVRSHTVNYKKGDEQVDILEVRVHKPDGTTLQDYDQWRRESSGGGKYYTDQAYVNIRVENVEPGDLVEYRYRIRQVVNENFRGDYFGDVSYLQTSKPIGFARYAVEYPSTWELYFQAPELEHRELENQLPGGDAPSEGYQVEGFELEDVPAVQTDPRQPGHTDVYDYVLVSNKKTWDAVGEWWWNLVEEQLIVNAEIKGRVDRLTEGLDSDREKVEAIHNWLVKNTRYLHVGLGIHGWKPYRTTECYSNKYGDCKDKSSLLKVMLEEAGIETNLVLVRTRDMGHIDPSVASMHVFNHAIDYIPSMDLFLDPTAEYNGTSELPPMDQGAQALIVEDGGNTRFTELPVEEASDNLLRRRLQVDMTGETTVTSGRVVARGQNAVYYRRTLESDERRDELLEKQLTNLYPGAELVSASYEHLDDLEKPVEIQFEFKGGRLRRTSEDRAFVFPYGSPKDLLSRYASQSERSQDLTIRVPFANATTMRYRLPTDEGFERVPESVELTSEFGSLTIEYSEEKDNTLVADIRYSLDVQRVPVEKYPEFRSFLSNVTSELNETIGLVEER